MNQTIIFYKTFEDRLLDYTEIFNDYEVLSVRDVAKVWTSFLELLLDPFGWQGIWKMPSSLCESLKIGYPTLALVYVENVNFEKLTASVKIINIQDHLALMNNQIDTYLANSMAEDSEKNPKSAKKSISSVKLFEAELVHLWLTNEQDSTTCLDAEEINDALDKLRFFYKHLWRPWDIDDDDVSIHWAKKHLKNRLDLYYDLKSGKIPRNIVCLYRNQLIEAKEKYQKITHLTEKMESDSINYDASSEDEDVAMDALCDLHSELTKLKGKLALFENPMLRSRRVGLQRIHKEKSEQWLVIHANKDWEAYTKFLNNVYAHTGTEIEANSASNLQQALENAGPNDTIFICDGKHIINGVYNLGYSGGSIINVNHPLEATIESTNEHAVFSIGNEATLSIQNVNIILNQTRYGIKLKQYSTLILKNSFITFNERNTDKVCSSVQCAIAANNSRVFINNCHISNVTTALLLNGNTEVKMEESTFSDIGFGIKMKDIRELYIADCNFQNVETCVVYWDSKKVNAKIEKLEDLQIESNITIKNAQAEGREVIFAENLKLQPVKDPLSNPQFNKTLKEE